MNDRERGLDRSPGWRPYIQTAEYHASVDSMKQRRIERPPDTGPCYGWIHWTAIEDSQGKAIKGDDLKTSVVKCCPEGHINRKEAYMCASLRFFVSRKRFARETGSAMAARFTLSGPNEAIAA